MDFDQLRKTLEEHHSHDPFRGQNTASELLQEDVVPFLESTIEGDMPVYVSYKGMFLYSVAVPVEELPKDLSNLPDFCVDVDPSFGYWVQFSDDPKPEDFRLSYPGETNRPEFLSKGIPLTALRDYRFNEKRQYIELPQDLTQMFSLHRDDETGHYCRIDQNGDKEAVCKIQIAASKNIVTIRDSVLFTYLLLKECVLVRLFDSLRSKGASPMWTQHEPIDRSIPERHIFANFQDNPSRHYHCSALRGGQIIGTDRDYVWEQAKQELAPSHDHKYCEFIIHDWKNDRITTCSCSPSETSTYFEPENEKPWGTSPAFFRPEVLDKYKNNPEKYRLSSRQIQKIDGWGLQTYDTNEHGQVHTYICYLARLPYEEQLYWKSFNEQPRSPISKRAFETDFLGNWTEIANPDEALIEIMEKAKNDLAFLFPGLNTVEMRWQIHRVHTDNQREWGDAILQLDQTIVESMDQGTIRSLAKKTGCVDESLGSIRQLQRIIEMLGYSKDELEPLVDLHYLRSKIRGHKLGTEAKEILKDIRKRFGSFPSHFDDLLSQITGSVTFLVSHKDDLTP
jgi:hypothetical protein